MSLIVDTTNVKDNKNVCYITDKDNTLHYTTPTANLAWGSMGIDIGDITYKNYKEVYFRHRFLSSILKYKLAFTLQDVKKHIGLHTNVAYNHRGVWKNRIVKNVMEELEYQIEKEQEKKNDSK